MSNIADKEEEAETGLLGRPCLSDFHITKSGPGGVAEARIAVGRGN